MENFAYSELLPTSGAGYDRRHIGSDGVSTVDVGGDEFVAVSPKALEDLTYTAYKEVNFYLRSSHLSQLRSIIDDPDASENDRYVALDLLKNASIASGGQLPMCQDTGTAIVMAKRGPRIITDGRDAESVSRGVFRAYRELNLRYSQLSPLTVWEEENTRNNLPAEIEISLGKGATYEFLFMAKGGGSANKSFLFQETKAILSEDRLLEFLREKIESIGTAACPPYHLAVVIGGTSAEFALKTAKLASAHYLDDLPRHGGIVGNGFRDTGLEHKVFQLTQTIGFGAQFGGKYFCHDVRVVRLPRHNGSLPIAIAVSCSADRQVLALINREGIFIEELEHDPARFIPDSVHGGDTAITGHAVNIDLSLPMDEIRAALSSCSVGDRVMLSGPMIVARDLAHAKLRERLERGGALPDYVREHPIYYAGPAKTPDGFPTGSFGPTTGGRMDSYVEAFQNAGGSLVMLAKGNRSSVVTKACAKYGGFYLGSVGGPAAKLAQEHITSLEVVDFPELGMEAVHKINVVNFPAFIVVDDKGNDFFASENRTRLSLGPVRRTGTDNA